MNRKDFLKLLAAAPLGLSAMKLKEFENIGSGFSESEKMPVLFVGHGSPMNAIEDNMYHQSWQALGKRLSPPKAILCISAHWLTRGTFVTMSEQPKTIHDFGGFPDALFQQQYPVPGAVDYARMTIGQVKGAAVHEDFEWGLDHGTWSVVKPMFPEAKIPVFQLSIDFTKPMQYHFDLAKELAFLRSKGVLIIGSGNIVHNLGMVKWNGGGPYDWAIEFDAFVKEKIEQGDAAALVDYHKLGTAAQMAVPTTEHYIPLIYSLGLRDKTDKLQFFNDTLDMGSLSMRSVIFS